MIFTRRATGGICEGDVGIIWSYRLINIRGLFGAKSFAWSVVRTWHCHDASIAGRFGPFGLRIRALCFETLARLNGNR